MDHVFWDAAWQAGIIHGAGRTKPAFLAKIANNSLLGACHLTNFGNFFPRQLIKQIYRFQHC